MNQHQRFVSRIAATNAAIKFRKTRCYCSLFKCLYGSFRKLGVPYLGVLIVRILLFRVLYLGPLFSEIPIYSLIFLN